MDAAAAAFFFRRCDLVALLFAMLNFLTVKPNKYNPIKIHSCHTCSARTIRLSIFCFVLFVYPLFRFACVSCVCAICSDLSRKKREWSRRTAGEIRVRWWWIAIHRTTIKTNGTPHTSISDESPPRSRTAGMRERGSEVGGGVTADIEKLEQRFFWSLMFAIAFGDSLQCQENGNRSSNKQRLSFQLHATFLSNCTVYNVNECNEYVHTRPVMRYALSVDSGGFCFKLWSLVSRLSPPFQWIIIGRRVFCSKWHSSFA